MVSRKPATAPSAPTIWRRTLLPGSLLTTVGAVAWSITGGLLSCDSTAKFKLDDVKFNDIQVVSVFPVRLDKDTKTASRVCGGGKEPVFDTTLEPGDAKYNEPLPVDQWEDAPEANGFELMFNMTSIGREKYSCTWEETIDGKVVEKHDLDSSVKLGERIESQPVIAGTAVESGVTLGAKNITLPSVCVGERGGASKGACLEKVEADALGYRSWGSRCIKPPQCDPTEAECKEQIAAAEASHVNVALVVDASASTTGMVDSASRCVGGGSDKHKCDPAKKGADCPGGTCSGAPSLLEDVEQPPIQGNIKATASDPSSRRVFTATEMLATLNAYDRAVAFYFNEDGVQIAASSSYKCLGGENEGADCGGKMVDGCPASGPRPEVCGSGQCLPDESEQDDPFSKLPNLLVDDAAANCAFGPMDPNKWYLGQLQQGLSLKVGSKGKGRSPIWSAVDVAYSFLTRQAKDNGITGPKHVVLVTDGPDTCEVSEQAFNFKDISDKPTGACRTTCSKQTTKYNELLHKVMRDQFDVRNGLAKVQPVIIDVIQFQARAPQYQEPDPRLMELACRTGGSYQFLSTDRFNTCKPQAPNCSSLNTEAWTQAFGQAFARVRNSLSGSWRAAFLADAAKPGATLGIGQIGAFDGTLAIASDNFPTLAPICTKKGADAGKASSCDFNLVQAADDESQTVPDNRLFFRSLSCSSNADCGGGGDPCASNHCASNGLCVSQPAPDRLPCSADGKKVCEGGVCKEKDATSCKTNMCCK